MKPRAYSNLKTLELLFQDKNSAQETKKKSSKKRGHVYRPEEITGKIISEELIIVCISLYMSRNEVGFGISFVTFI